MNTPEEHSKLLVEILESIEREERIKLYLFKAKLIKDKYQDIVYLKEHVVGYYYYSFVKSKHYIKNLVDGQEYEIEYESIRPFIREKTLDYIDDNLIFNGEIILIDIPLEDYLEINQEVNKYLELNNILIEEIKLCEIVEIITFFILNKYKRK